jgi:hypothetical protein
LRPLVAEVFARLVEEGHSIYVWSGVRTGDIIRTEVVERYGLQPYVTDCFRKPLFDYLEQWRRVGGAIQPEFCVDDYPDIVEAFGGVLIKPYTAAAIDADMERVYAAIQAETVRIAQDGPQPA